MLVSEEAVQRGLAGGVAGFVATAPMSIAMVAMKQVLPRWQKGELPPGQVTRRVEEVVGAEDDLSQDQHTAATALAHFGYGAAAAMPYGALAPRLPMPTALSGLIYGLAVWTGSYLGLLPALRLFPPATKHPWQRNVLMILAHVVWGTALGLFYRTLRSQP